MKTSAAVAKGRAHLFGGEKLPAKLMEIDLRRIKPHPENYRVPREHVIAAIAVGLRDAGCFPAEHAITVRPVGRDYQVVAGHRRVAAAERAKLKSVWAWVRELSDDDALMELLLSNKQGEDSPLEIGLHAYRAVPSENGGRGKKGGLSAYAKRIGRSLQDVSRCRHAAEVLGNPHDVVRVSDFLDQTYQLAEIHKAEARYWPALVERLRKHGWPVEVAKAKVAGVNAFDFPAGGLRGDLQDRWLAPVRVIERYLDTDEFSPQTVRKLIATADATFELIASYDDEQVNRELALRARSEHNGLLEWLVAHSGSASWDVRKLIQQQREIQQRLEEEVAVDGWHQGDFRDHVNVLADGSVSLLLTDPPYGTEFQSDRRTDRSKPRRHAKIKNDDRDAFRQELMAFLTLLKPKLAESAHVLVFCGWRTEPEFRSALAEAGLMVRGSLVWAKNHVGMGDPSTTFAPKHERILHAVKGNPVLFERQGDVLQYARVLSDDHPTEKPVDLLKRLIEVTTVKGDLLADPFAGVASVPVAGISLGRRFWACELDKEYHAKGLERIKEARARAGATGNEQL